MKNLSQYHLLSIHILFLYSKIEKTITKVNKYTLCGYSVFTQFAFDAKINKHFYYTGKYCIEKFCKNGKRHANEIMNSEKWK